MVRNLTLRTQTGKWRSIAFHSKQPVMPDILRKNILARLNFLFYNLVIARLFNRLSIKYGIAIFETTTDQVYLDLSVCILVVWDKVNFVFSLVNHSSYVIYLNFKGTPRNSFSTVAAGRVTPFRALPI